MTTSSSTDIAAKATLTVRPTSRRAAPITTGPPNFCDGSAVVLDILSLQYLEHHQTWGIRSPQFGKFIDWFKSNGFIKPSRDSVVRIQLLIRKRLRDKV